MGASASPQDNRSAVVALVALGAFALALFAPSVLNDPDTWWHVTVGQWILDHGQAPRADHWSYSRSGAPWTAHEWLSEALMAGAYRLGGWTGVTALTAAAFGAAAWILGRRLACDLGGTALLVLLVLSLSLLGPHLLARPHILALPVFAAWTALLVRARERNSAPPLWAAALMTLWANLHGGWAFGFALAGPFALEALLEAPPAERLRVVVGWGAFGLLSLAAAAVTPFGIEGVLFPVQQLGLRNLGGIGEWRPADFTRIEPLQLALLALVAMALTRPLRLPPLRLILLLGLIHLSLSHIRHEMLLALVAPMILSRPLAEALGAPEPAPAWRSRVTAAATVAALALLAVRVALPVSRGEGPSSPSAALAAAGALRDAPVLNDYAFGGYLIWSGVRPYVDSRAELYRDAFLGEYGDLAAGDEAALDAVLARTHATWTMFSPGQGVVRTLDHKPGWKRLYADRFAVVHMRSDAR